MNFHKIQVKSHQGFGVRKFRDIFLRESLYIDQNYVESFRNFYMKISPF